MKQTLYSLLKVNALLLLLTGSVVAQFPVVDLNFNGYNGTSATVPAGFYYSWHSTTSLSYYTSAGNFGDSSPSYKFGNDSVYIVTHFVNQADSIRFWSKGNGSPFSPLNELRIYYSPDSVNWNLITTVVPLSSSGTITTIPLSQQSGNFKIEYGKSAGGGNLAFDDLKIFANNVIGVPASPVQESVSVYPTPTNGLLNIKITHGTGPVEVEVFDMLGNAVKEVPLEKKSKNHYTLDLTGKNRGFYFVKIQTPHQFITKRITVSN